MEWIMWLFLALPFIIIAVGLGWVHYSDQRGINARPKEKRYQDDFSLMLDTPAKKARHLKEHREWDSQFNELAFQEMIVWNGVLMTKEQADYEFFKEQQEQFRRYEK